MQGLKKPVGGLEQFQRRNCRVSRWWNLEWEEWDWMELPNIPVLTWDDGEGASQELVDPRSVGGVGEEAFS